MKTLNVLYQSSAAYAIPAAVSICSLCENNRKIEDIHIWFIDGGLTAEDRARLLQLAKRYRRKLTFLSGKETDEMLEAANVQLWSNSYATFYKVFVSAGIPEIDSILYIDSDTLVLGSLAPFCDLDIGNYACAMVSSAMTGAVKQFIGTRQYFNAGIVYFNLRVWREQHLKEKFLKVIGSPKSRKYTLIGDETLINYVLRGKIRKLPLRYNMESSWGLWGWNRKLYPQLGWDSETDCYYTPEQIRRARSHPVIAHYVDLTTGRPWDYLNDNPFRREFEQYSAILKPWKKIDFAMRGIGGNSKAAAWAKWTAKKLMPTAVRSRLGFMQHDSYWKKRIADLQADTQG